MSLRMCQRRGRVRPRKALALTIEECKERLQYHLVEVKHPLAKMLARYFLKKLIELSPTADNYLRMARFEYAAGSHRAAISLCDEALALTEGSVKLELFRALFELPSFFESGQELSLSRERFCKALAHLKESLPNRSPEQVAEGYGAVQAILPFYLAYQGQNDRELSKLYGETIEKIVAARLPGHPEVLPKKTLGPGERIRIGFPFSFPVNSVGWKFPLRGYLSQLNRDVFELCGYALSDKPQARCTEISELFDRFAEHQSSIEGWVDAIKADAPHILVYPRIGMDPAIQVLASLRLAPVQCTCLGHFVTTGLPKVDYFLSSDTTEPPDAQEHYTETLVRLPNLGVYYLPGESLDTSAVTRKHLGLTSGATVFHCAQSYFKYLPEHDWVFAELASRVPNCQLYFRKDRRYESRTRKFRSRLSKVFADRGLDFRKFAVWQDLLDNKEFQASYELSDVFLEPIATGGVCTVLDAVHSNLPIVAFKGRFLRNRGGYAILKQMGMETTVATTIEEYLEMAVELGTKRELRRSLGESIAENKHKLNLDRMPIDALENFLCAQVNTEPGE